MATPLDLQEQEQVDALKAFWQRYGNLITWVLVAVLGAFAAWNGWQLYQRKQAEQAGAMFDELDRAAAAADVDKVARVFADLKERHPRTVHAQQAGLVAAKVQLDKGKEDDARATLAWVADTGRHEDLAALARLRLAGVLLDAKKYDEALAQLDAAKLCSFAALGADRRGDVLAAQGRAADAVAAYQAAWKGIPESMDYRRLVEAKLTALGAAPAASGAGK
jgi:predicted negative regulator of RcsB-dependent stress response